MATLQRNGADGKATPSNLPPREVIRCPDSGCGFSYMLFYTDAEIQMVGPEKNIDTMRRTAADLIRNQHPPHFTNTYLWKAIGTGPECHWVEADSLAARKAL